MADSDDTTDTPDTEPPEEMVDMKAKFREALEKKNASKHASADGVERDGSEKSHGADGPTGPREFRRKSV